MQSYVLSIDQGTTGTTVSIIGDDGRAVVKVNKEYPQIFPQPGWVEHNPEDIWQSVLACIKDAVEKSKIQVKQIVAIGITNQRETVAIWDRVSGKPMSNAIVWQDRRTTDLCLKMKKRGLEKTIRKKTGLVIDPYFSASKIKWMLDHIPGARKRALNGELVAGTVDTFLIWRLSDGAAHATDVSNASRTMLMNINKGDWDVELLKLFEVPPSLLPIVMPSSGQFAVTKRLGILPDGIPITGVAGDQQAALFGQTCFSKGEAKCTFGTGSFILLNTGSKAVPSRSGLLTTVAWKLKGDKNLTYALEGGAFICGAAVQFLRDQMGFISSSAEVESLSRQVDDSGGVEFVPAMAGLGAPWWDPEARGMISGLTRGSTRAHIARATLEAMALQNVDILEAMQKDSKVPLKELRVDGGAVANNLLMQLQADYLNRSITRPQWTETTSAGAAYLAGLGVGLWSDLDDIRKVWSVDKKFVPTLAKKKRAERMAKWHAAIERVRL